MPHFGEPTPEGPGKRRFCRITTGSYTGDGAVTQAIGGVGFQPKVVIIYIQNIVTEDYFIATDQDGGFTKFSDVALGTWEYRIDFIISLDIDGFTVGDGTGIANLLNTLGTTYTYICLG